MPLQLFQLVKNYLREDITQKDFEKFQSLYSVSKDCKICNHTYILYPDCGNYEWICPNCRPQFLPKEYTPTEWVKEVVGKKFKGTNNFIYTCTSYDRRHGFWMSCFITDYILIDTNVSEAAINRSYHQIYNN
jgi:PHP family Zn ribbon phosphoesterase